MITRMILFAAIAAAMTIPAEARRRDGGDRCVGIRCHDGGGSDAWITHEKVYGKRLTRKQAYRICKDRYPIMSDIIMFRISKGWECRIRRP